MATYLVIRREVFVNGKWQENVTYPNPTHFKLWHGEGLNAAKRDLDALWRSAAMVEEKRAQLGDLENCIFPDPPIFIPGRLIALDYVELSNREVKEMHEANTNLLSPIAGVSHRVFAK